MVAKDLERGPSMPLRFGLFSLDAGRAELVRGDEVLRLRPKAFALLSYFASRPGRVLGKAELLAAVWPGVVVTDDSLTQCVNELRAVLGDSDHRLIRTISRRGYLFDAASSPAASPPDGARKTRRPLWRWPAAAAVAAVTALLIGVAALWNHGQVRRIDPELLARRSVVVLPFKALDGDTRPFFAEAVTEDLIANLARLPHTQVIALASATEVAAKGLNLREIGRTLAVGYALSGSVRRQGSAVQLTAQLASTASGTVLWAAQFDYSGASEWAWERDVARQVARALDLQLTAAAAPAPTRATGRLDVLDKVMEAQYLVRHSTGRDDLLRARAAFEAALAVDPQSLGALCGFALATISYVTSLYSENPKEHLAQAAEAIDRALSIDPDYTLAHYARGHVLFRRGDLEGALREYRRVLAANPSDAWAHVRVATVLLEQGQLEQVEPEISAARRLNPLEGLQMSVGHYVQGVAQFHLGDEDAAYAHMKQAAAAKPGLVQSWIWLAAIDSMHGRHEKAAEELAEVRRLRPKLTLGALQRRASEVPISPRLEPGQRRYIAALKAAGLPE